MKRKWQNDELMAHWYLEPDEQAWVLMQNTAANRLGLALLLKWFQYEGRFPNRPQDIPPVVLTFLASQIEGEAADFKTYGWGSRTMERQRAWVRERLGFRPISLAETDALKNWLLDTHTAHERDIEMLAEAVYDRCRVLKLEPPTPSRIERLVRSALRAADEQCFELISQRLPQDTRDHLDAILEPPVDGPPTPQPQTILTILKQGPGAGFNTLVTAITADSLADLYLAAMVGAVSVSSVAFLENRYPKQQEILVNMPVGAVGNTALYMSSQLYEGKDTPMASITSQFVGGMLGPAFGILLVRPWVSPGRGDDFITAGASSFMGGYVGPTLLEPAFEAIAP